jgi:integrase
MSTTGIESSHGKSCPGRRGGRCNRNGCSWRAKAHSVRSPRFATLAEAQEWRRLKLGEAKADRLSGPVPAITLTAAWALWVTAAESGRIHSRSGAPYKPVTVRDYSEALRGRVLPDYGENRLADVTPAGLRRLVADLRESGLSASAIRNTVNPLRALFRDAPEVVPGWNGTGNPTTGLKLPKVSSRRTADRIPAPEQTTALVAAAPERDRALWATAAYAGLRRGELRALRCSDVDFKAGKIKVRRSWDRVEGEIDPKSDAGARDVPLMGPLRPLLAAACAGRNGGLVFGTRTGGPFDPGDVSKRAAKAWTAAKVDPNTLHELRHGFAAVCAEAGVNAKRLQTWMGHSSITTTFDLYGKLLDRSEAAQTALVDEYLSAVGPSVGPLRADEGGLERSEADSSPSEPSAPTALETAL